MGSESPQRAACCFCFSAKTSDVKRGTSNGFSGSNMEDQEWAKNDEILSDLGTFSVTEQERRLKKALKEEERASKEAERVVQWVKQESARIDAAVINTLISDDDKGTTK